ncbi:hypothetical protein SAMN04488512_105176 [Sulfitobacter litoralis]|uniref:Uncharacterized protein n=1 Tax=Sulfitobacter litoralis TaxID=335975 RepID=A0ABY0S418_9RHOB|nr:hypothetical protein SAMN04488512_105176 [Sulfitobacter litoralis]
MWRVLLLEEGGPAPPQPFWFVWSMLTIFPPVEAGGRKLLLERLNPSAIYYKM